METIEKFISNLVESQFPLVYREEGPVFTAFLRAYFEWMESEGNALWYTRRLFELKDVDETLDSFLTHFKNKYLYKIPLNTDSDVRNLIKHSLDLYRSKGTPRGVQLLFQLVFGESIDLYFPSEDIFRLSDGKYVIPMYLEVTLQDNNKQFVNKQITGLKSEATAFVERVVRRTVGTKLLDVFYISAITGHFQTGEKIQTSDLSIDIKNCPSIIGSLTSLEISVDGSGQGFAIGDIVDVLGGDGIGGKARVVDVSDIVGTISFELIDAGYGFSASSEVLISESILTVANLQINSTPFGYFQLFETISQPRASINYLNTTGDFANGDDIYTYYPNNSIKGHGNIYEITTTNSTAGEIKFFIQSGDLNDDPIFTSANAITANVDVANGYNDRTATANVMGISSNISLLLTTCINAFSVGETLVSTDSANNIVANGTISLISGVIGGNAQVFVTNTHGIFFTNTAIYGLSSGAQANLYSYTIDLGVIDSDSFSNAPFNYIIGGISQTNAQLTIISQGSDASFSISTDDLSFVETVNVNSDLIRDYFEVALAATAYGFPANTTANATNTFLVSCLSWLTENVGVFPQLHNINPGSNYNKAPMVRVYDRLSAGADAVDVLLTLDTGAGSFSIGETVEQAATNARGIVQSGNSSLLTLRRLSVLNDFVPTVNATTIIVGDDSGAEANVTVVDFKRYSDAVGFNANISDHVQTDIGAITKINVTDSGFGYKAGQFVFLKANNNDSIGVAKTFLNGPGIGTGFYREKGGFLSDQKKLYDGYYYQEFSYEIRSSLTLDKYKDMMINVMHFAGSKMFGALVHFSDVDANATIHSEVVTTA